MSCPFYGRYASTELGLIEQGGNQCAIILDSFAPCLLEQVGLPVDGKECELLRMASEFRAIMVPKGPFK